RGAAQPPGGLQQVRQIDRLVGLEPRVGAVEVLAGDDQIVAGELVDGELTNRGLHGVPEDGQPGGDVVHVAAGRPRGPDEVHGRHGVGGLEPRVSTVQIDAGDDQVVRVEVVDDDLVRGCREPVAQL